MKIQLNNPFSIDDQRKFWRRIHKLLSKNGGWWNLRQRRIWIDFVYRPGEQVKVYFSIPRSVGEKVTALLTPNGRRKSTLGNAASIEVDKKELFVPRHLSTCELKLAHENLFSLSTVNQVKIPLQVPLDDGEVARISFCIEPTIPDWFSAGKQAIQEKTEKGLIRIREHKRMGMFSFLIMLFSQLMKNSFVHKVDVEKANPWLSRETLKKWNDCHFKTIIRISGPQRLLPKLSRPFQTLQGENRLHIHFLARKENKAGLREINKQRLGLFSLRDRQPNVLASRELIAMAPLLSLLPEDSGMRARPNFL